MKTFQMRNTNRPIDVVDHWRKNEWLNLNPPYQRGEVWGPIRQKSLIFSLVVGIPIPSIVVNDRASAGLFETEACEDITYAIIDGKQRIRAILAWIDGELGVPGEWFDSSSREVTFDQLDLVTRRKFRNKTLAFSEAVLGTIEQEKQVFELINYGGVPQGQSDLVDGDVCLNLSEADHKFIVNCVHQVSRADSLRGGGRDYKLEDKIERVLKILGDKPNKPRFMEWSTIHQHTNT